MKKLCMLMALAVLLFCTGCALGGEKLNCLSPEDIQSAERVTLALYWQPDVGVYQLRGQVELTDRGLMEEIGAFFNTFKYDFFTDAEETPIAQKDEARFMRRGPTSFLQVCFYEKGAEEPFFRANADYTDGGVTVFDAPGAKAGVYEVNGSSHFDSMFQLFFQLCPEDLAAGM